MANWNRKLCNTKASPSRNALYGSSGVGGSLKLALRSSLRRRQKEGTIRGYIEGEKFETFDKTTQEALDDYPELSSDPDFNDFNEGVTFVLL